MTSREQQYLLDILVRAEDAMSFVRGESFESFAADPKTQLAVLHCLTIIGEAAGRFTKMAAAEVAGLPWQKMKDLRNLIVHDYEGVNLPIIWDIVTTALDPLFPERPKP